MLIEAYELGRIYQSGEGKVLALDDVHLGVRPGELVALSGPSGCGKTSLLQILGLIDPDYQGRLFFAGRDARSMETAERNRLRLARIGIVFQGFNLLPALTVCENVALPHWRLNGNRAQAERAAARLLSELGLEHRLDHIPARLSGGEQQRVALARALVNDPWLVLADEPTAHLDVTSTHAILDRFAQLRQRGRAVVVASHDPSVARYADREVRLRFGRLVPPARTPLAMVG